MKGQIVKYIEKEQVIEMLEMDIMNLIIEEISIREVKKDQLRQKQR